MAQVDAYLASGLKAGAWAQANGVELRDLASWCAHAKRWRARLDGAGGVQAAGVSGCVAVGGFVAAQVVRTAPSRPGCEAVRVELSVGATAVTLHWPTQQPRELAAWLKELGR